MRLYRNALILVVVLGLLVGAYFYLNNKKGNDAGKEESGDQPVKVWELDKTKLAQLTVEGKDGKIVIENKDNKLVLSEPANLKASQSKLDEMVSNAAVINADKVVEENTSDLVQYGLDKPVVFTVKLQDGTAKIGQIGDKTPSGSGYYFKEKENNKIYTLGTYAGEALLASRNDLREKKLFDASKDDVTGFSLERAGKTVFSVRQDGSGWNLLAPFEGNADAAKLAAIFQAASEASVSAYVEENAADLDKYGLKNPAYSIEVDSKDGKKKLLIGDEKEKGVEFFAKFADSNEVFTTSEANFNYLDKPLKEIIDVFVYIVNIDDVSKIEADMNGTKAVADISTDKDNKDNDKFSINGKSVMDIKSGEKTGDGLFRVYYQSLIGVTMESIDMEAKPSGKPYLTISYTLKKAPGSMKIEFIQKDADSFYAFKNGKYTNIVVTKEQVDKVSTTYNNLMEAVNGAK